MKCKMCGYVFNEKIECGSCGMDSCGKCRCPVCGYSEPPPSRLGVFYKKMAKKVKDVK